MYRKPEEWRHPLPKNFFKPEVVTMDAALLVVEGSNGEQYGIFIPKDGTPINLAVLLSAVWTNPLIYFPHDDIGEFTTQLLLNLRNNINISAKLVGLVNTFTLSQTLGKVQHHYRVAPIAPLRLNVSYRTVVGGRLGRSVVDGTLTDLLNFTDPSYKLKEHVGKIVRFSYKKDGTAIPEIKVVRLDNVIGNGNNVLIKGVDVTKKEDTGGDAFRTYNWHKIVGNVEVLN